MFSSIFYQCFIRCKAIFTLFSCFLVIFKPSSVSSCFGRCYQTIKTDRLQTVPPRQQCREFNILNVILELQAQLSNNELLHTAFKLHPSLPCVSWHHFRPSAKRISVSRFSSNRAHQRRWESAAFRLATHTAMRLTTEKIISDKCKHLYSLLLTPPE